MNTKLILLSVFTVLYFLGTQWWYSNKLAGVCCSGTDQAEETVAAASGEDPVVLALARMPLAFKWMEANPIMGSNYDDFKTNTILSGMTEDNILQITGHYYQKETAGEDFDNMGLARADAMRQALQEDIPADRIDIASRLLDDNETMETMPFEGVTFNWKAPLKKEETTIVEIDNEITIYFPFNSSVKDQNPQVDEYLHKLAERLSQTSERVAITGHTDNVGEPQANVNLGLRRAESIRNILVGKGVAADRISTASKGEAQPATSNDTEDGRHRNRRTVLQVVGG